MASVTNRESIQRVRADRMRRPSRAAPILTLVAVLAVLGAAGCGSSSDKETNEAYANSVCTAVGNWKQQIQSIATSLGGGVTPAAIQTSITQAQAATKTLVSQVKAVEPPDSSEGQAAKQQLDQLTTDIDNTINAAQPALVQLQANPSVAGISATIAALAPQIQNLANETKSAIDTLKSAGGSLGDAFTSTESCKNLGDS
jgi:hypothetical protein